MTDFIRRLVSGNKARFKDDELKLELDLVYVTDQIIIMGYPASGFEGYYRNRKEDVKKFLDHRHPANYWIFNFCPLRENAYDAEYFGGRVSRFPFPDHHAPPLAIMPLVAREMNAWLSGSSDRVAVLHCKAGKGRSGTMACTYLLSLGSNPVPPKLQRSHSAKEWAKLRAEETMNALPQNQELEEMKTSTSPLLHHSPPPLNKPEVNPDTTNIIDPVETGHPPPPFMDPVVSPITSLNPNPEISFTDALKGVLDLHTARRMKPTSHPSEKAKQGVSIPSQRRYLYYWALLLAYEAPPGFWSLTPPPSPSLSFSLGEGTGGKRRVRLTEIKLRLRELSSVKLNLVKAANIVIDKTKTKAKLSSSVPTSTTATVNNNNDQSHKSQSDTSSTEENRNKSTTHHANQVWVSLARYDDDFISTLEKWEKHTRDEKKGQLGVRKPGSKTTMVTEEGKEEELNKLFVSDSKWDKHKMVRSFAKMGEVARRAETQGVDKDEKILTYTLQPLTNNGWESIKKDIQDNSSTSEQVKTEDFNLSQDENSSLYESKPTSVTSATATTSSNLEQGGIVLDAEREVRVKLYMGQVFMGWIWLIPAFHMTYPTTTSAGSVNNNETSPPAQSPTTTIHLTRKEVDFPIGLGAGIVDVELSFEWVIPSDVRQKAAVIANPEKRSEVVKALSEPPSAQAEDGGSSGDEPAVTAATLGSVVAQGVGEEESVGGGLLRKIVETRQGAED